MRWRGRRRAGGLGAWWAFAAVLLAGLAMATLGRRMLVGGAVMAMAFVLAAGLRGFRADTDAAGLHIRGKTSDVVTYLLVAALVLGAILAVDLGPVRR